MIGIYKITNPNGKIYIWQSINIEKRFVTYKRLSCKNQTRLYNSLKKHGYENHLFEIVCECLETELNDKERFYQDLYDVLGNKGLNCFLTKSKDKSGKGSKELTEKKKKFRHSEESKIKISAGL